MTSQFALLKNIFKISPFLIFIFSSVSCTISYPTPMLALKPAIPTNYTIQKKAWLAPVEISNPSVKNSITIQQQLTGNVLEYLRKGRYFREINLLPGQVNTEDILLRFKFNRFNVGRKSHPAVFPCAFFTVGFYFWFGGPVINDIVDLNANLIVEDARGSVIANTSSETKGKSSFSVYSATGGTKPNKHLTLIISQLLDTALAQLRTGEGVR